MAIKVDLSELSINQLQDLTGKSYRTVKRRLERLEPIGKSGREIFFNPREALPLIYGPEVGSDEGEHGEDTTRMPPGLALTKERTRYERARADKTELEVKVLKGKLIPADKVEDVWSEMIGNFRAKMLVLPTRAALECAQKTEPNEIETFLRALVTRRSRSSPSMTQINSLLELARRVAKTAAPPPELTVSQWADAERRLSAESSAEPGRWITDRAPYQREIMDAFSDPRVERVIGMTSAQIGKTEILNNVVGYFAHHDPAPMLILQPTLELAEAYSKDRLAP